MKSKIKKKKKQNCSMNEYALLSVRKTKIIVKHL